MASTKITQKETSTLKTDAYVLVTQPEDNGEGNRVDSLRRIPLEDFLSKIGAVRTIEKRVDQDLGPGFMITYADGTPQFIQIESSSSDEYTLEYDDETNTLYQLKNGQRIDEGVPNIGGTGGLAFNSMRQDPNTGLVYATLDGEDVEGWIPAEFSVGGGGTTINSRMNFRSLMTSKAFSIMDTLKELLIRFNWSSIDKDTEEPTGDGSAGWFVNGKRIATRTVAQGDCFFDVRPYLTTGQTNEVKLQIDDAYGNYKIYPWSITVTAYSLTWNLLDMENHGETADCLLRIVANGSGDKTLVVAVDGTEHSRQTISTTGKTTNVSIPASKLGHGAHAIEAWLEVNVDGETISTDHLRHVGIWKQSTSAVQIVAVYDDAITMSQLATYPVRYMVYDPSENPAEVTLSEDGTVLSTLNVGREMQTWYYRANEAEDKTLTIRCGVTPVTIPVTVESLGYDISPITNGLVIHLDPTGHSNAEATRTSFGYKDASGNNHPLLLSDGTARNPSGVVYPAFDWVNGGFQVDGDGVTAFVVRRGCRAWFDRSLFSDNAKATGKNIEIIFKSVNVRDFDAEIMSCLANNIGLKFYANTGYFRCQSTSVDMKWCEDMKAEICLSVEPSTGKEKPSMEFWDNGTPGRGRIYLPDTMWLQSDPEYFCIGSDDADVWVYRLRAYESFLTEDEIRSNFIADAPTPEEAVRRYLQNHIFTDDGSTISIQRLINAAPDLHVIEIKTAGFPKDKKTFVPCTIEHWLGSGGPDHHWWTDSLAKYVLQGTSSMNYIESCGNLDLSLVDAEITNENGTTMTDGYAMTENSIPVRYFNAKANTASSDNANNTVSAALYNEFDPFEPLAKTLDPRVRDSVEGHPVAVFITNTSDTAFKCGSDLAREVQPGETILYLAGDLNNSKLTTNVFGQSEAVGTDENGVGVFCVEFMDNGYPRCKFHEEATMLNETWDNGNGGQFEFRYPTKKAIDPDVPTPVQVTDAMKIKFIEMQNWLCRLNPANATNRSLDSAVTLYNPATGLDETFLKDTATYRGCKFRAEVANYFHVNSIVYYYVFTSFFLGVDQRAKNTFCTYEPDKNGVWRFSYRAYYDGDTICGINNKGALTLDYGIEDTDEVGDGFAFNAYDSVLWCMVRDYLPDYCTNEFSRLEVAGLIDENFLNRRFDSYQSIRPEALMTADFRNKYNGPLDRNGTTTYYEQMQNGLKFSQRHFFFHFQIPYMQSKYQSAVARNTSLLMDAYYSATGAVTAEASVVITPYMDMWLTMKCDNFGTKSVRAKKGVPTTVTVSGKDGSKPAGDTATQIFNGPWISAFNSLAQFYSQQFSGSNMRKLRRLPLGSSVSGYENRNLTTLGLTGLPMLEYLNLGGLVNLTSAVDLSGCPFLEEVYAYGSGISGIKLARGASVKVMQLPSVSNLTALDLQKLQSENFSMGTGKISLIHVENSPGVNTQSIVMAANTIAYGRLIGVNWNMDNADPVLKLIGKTGLDENGEAEGTFVLTGNVHFAGLTEEEHTKIRSAFPELNVTYQTPYLEAHTVTFKNYDGSTLKLKDETDAVFTVRHGGNVVNPVNAGTMDTPVRPDTAETHYVFTVWDKSLSNITEDTIVTAQFGEMDQEYTVRWFDGNGDEMTQYTVKVGAHETAIYTGRDLEDRGSGDSTEYFMGWDKLTNDVTSNLDVYPRFIRPVLPDSKPSSYDYLYSDDPADDSAYSLAEFWGVMESANAAAYCSPFDKVKIVMPAGTSVISDNVIECVVGGFNRQYQVDKGAVGGVYLVMANLLNATHSMNSSNTNEGGWPASAMRNWLNLTVFPALPIQWRKMMKTCRIRSTAGNTSTDIVTSDDKLWLLSYTEVGFSTAAPYINEVHPDVYGQTATNAVLPIFTDNASRIKRIGGASGTASYWWLRSPAIHATNWYNATYNGGSNTYNGTLGYGVAFGFSI